MSRRWPQRGPNSCPPALQGSVDFGPEVTSSDKSLKVLLNAEDKVRVRVERDLPRTTAARGWAAALGRSQIPGRFPYQLGSDPNQDSGTHLDFYLGRWKQIEFKASLSYI